MFFPGTILISFWETKCFSFCGTLSEVRWPRCNPCMFGNVKIVVNEMVLAFVEHNNSWIFSCSLDERPSMWNTMLCF